MDDPDKEIHGKETLPNNPTIARTIREKINNYVIEDGVLYRKSYLGPRRFVHKAINAGTKGTKRRYDIGNVSMAFQKMRNRHRGSPSESDGEAKVPQTTLPNATIVTDNGTQLINKPLKSWAEGIKTSVYQEGAGWVEELPNVLWAHITMPKISNGETPFSLAYGTEAVIQVEI
ncbi:reverse transcriptase domain-containing protein, partial [Tanacetum coccineum]